MPHTHEEQYTESDSLFARNGTSDIFGPLDDEVVIRINGDVKLDSMRRARQLGYQTHSEYVRMLMAKDNYGEEHVISLIVKRAMGDTTSVLRVPVGVSK